MPAGPAKRPNPVTREERVAWALDRVHAARAAWLRNRDDPALYQALLSRERELKEAERIAANPTLSLPRLRY